MKHERAVLGLSFLNAKNNFKEYITHGTKQFHS